MSAKRFLWRNLNRFVSPLGIELARAGTAPSFRFTLENLKANGFSPRTIFDIGVARGTPDLYTAFPDAKYWLFDPTRESLAYMQELARRLNAEVVNIALGDRRCTLAIDVRANIGESTLFEEVGTADTKSKYDVDVERFDSIITEFDRPALCKIDVQGAELMVLRGMGARLRAIEVVIVEVSSIVTLHGGAAEAIEVIKFMDEAGFAIHDICGIARRPLDGAMAQFDIVFCRRQSRLRGDHRWDGVRQAAPPPKEPLKAARLTN
jgi:FkbM family methyltransferase